MKSGSVTSKVVSLTLARGEVYLIQLLSDKVCQLLTQGWFDHLTPHLIIQIRKYCDIAIIYFTTLLYDSKFEMFSDIKGVMK